MKHLIETIVKPLVDYPEDVNVNVSEEDATNNLSSFCS